MTDADRDALWPDGVDLDGQRAMCQGIIGSMCALLAVYVGTGAVRNILVSMIEDQDFWVALSKQAALQREHLSREDEIGKILDEHGKKGQVS